MLVNLIRDQYTKAAENVGTTADVLHIFGCTKEAKMLRSKLGFVFTTNIIAIQLLSVLVLRVVTL